MLNDVILNAAKNLLGHFASLDLPTRSFTVPWMTALSRHCRNFDFAALPPPVPCSPLLC